MNYITILFNECFLIQEFLMRQSVHGERLWAFLTNKQTKLKSIKFWEHMKLPGILILAEEREICYTNPTLD